MRFDDTLLAGAVGLAPLAIAAYLALYGPGHALWGGRDSGIPRAFARLALSLVVSSVTLVLLLAFESFSLPRFVVTNAGVTLFGYLAVARAREPGVARIARGRLMGAVVFILTLTAYWPPYEAHIAGSDSSAYLASGVQLARYHTLSKPDDLGPLVPAIARGFLFFSTLGMPWKPPYSRMHGGIVVDSLGAGVAHPSFFPLPSAWSALFSDLLGARFGGGYAGLFGAAAVWAAYLLARYRLGPVAAALVALLTAANAACYWAGRVALAEPLAWFFLCGALVALDAFERDGSKADARLAGALLGATAMARVEYAAFVLAVLLARVALRPWLRTRALTLGFVVALGVTLSMVAVEVFVLHGAFVAPLVDVARGIEWIVGLRWREARWTLVVAGFLAIAAYALAVRRIGAVRASAATGVAAFFLTYLRFSPEPWPWRATGWLGAYIGWPTLALAVIGGFVMWRDRSSRPADGFLIVMLAVIGGCLIVDPHVMPAMPWASRRFVPLVVPAALLLATVACAVLGRRSLVLGLAAYLVLAASVLAPARAMWGRDYYAGTYDQLREFVDSLPTDGSLMIDNRLVPMLLGPPLWLTYGRNSLPAVANTKTGRDTIAGMTYILTKAGKGPVYLIKPTLTGGPEPIPLIYTTRVTDYSFQISLPEQTDGPPPKHLQKYTQPVEVLRLQIIQ